MSENGNGSMNGANGRPHALLRAGFPFYTTLGMRRVTTYPMDIVIGDEDRLYVLNPHRRSGWSDPTHQLERRRFGHLWHRFRVAGSDDPRRRRERLRL